MVLLTTPDKLGPTEEEESEFDKELAKMVTDASAESRKVDKRTAQVLWDTTILTTGSRKKKVELSDEEDGDSGDTASDSQGTMKFTMLTRKGNRQQVSLDWFSVDIHINCRFPSGEEDRHSSRVCIGYAYPHGSRAR